MSEQAPNRPEAGLAEKPSGTASRAPQDQRLTGLNTIIQLERDARHAETVETLGFVMVNETGRLVRYRQALLWRATARGRAAVIAASAVPMIERNAPMVRTTERIARALVTGSRGRDAGVAQVEEAPDNLRREWREWFPPTIFWQPLTAPDGTLLGGLIFVRDEAWTEAEATLLDRLSDAYAHAWAALVRPGRRRAASWLSRRLLWLVLLLLLVAAMFIPVRQSVVAPAEVVARDADVVAAPIRGVVKSVDVAPNQPVKAGQVLFRLDDTEIRNRFAVAEKAWEVARADYLRAAQRAFSDAESKAQLALLQNRVALRKAEMDYQKALLDRIQVRAPRAGIAVFADRNDWIGRPVDIGQKIMTIAGPRDTWLEIWVPVEDAINLEPGAGVRFFLNIDPLSPFDGTLKQTSFEAERSPSDVLAYRLKAEFSGAAANPRLGLKGTAKVYGARTTLFYFLFRRPLAAVRRLLGL